MLTPTTTPVPDPLPDREKKGKRRPKPFSRGERWLLVLCVTLAGGVSGLGLVSSYSAVEAKAAAPLSEGGWAFTDPWMLPIGIDLSILGFSLVNLLLIRSGRRLAWVAWVPRAGAGVTIWLNWASSVSLPAQLGHAVLASLWVVFSEIAAHLYASHIGEADERERMEGVRLSRRLLSPIASARIARQMTLWEIPSYEMALRRDQERLVYRQMLRKEHGKKWRRTAPSDALLPIRLARFGLSVDEALDVPADAAERERLRAERERFRQAESELRRVESEARIRTAHLEAEAAAIRAEGQLALTRTEAQNATSAELRRAEEELRLREARAQADVARIAAEAEAEAARTRREAEEEQLRWDADRLRAELEAKALESAEAAEARAREAAAEAERERAEAEAAKAAEEAAESRARAAESERAEAESRAKAADSEAEWAAAQLRIARDRQDAAAAEAKAAELEAEARMTPTERDVRRVADMIRELGDDALTLEAIAESLGVSVTTAHDRRKRARKLLGLSETVPA
ncbi:DUF2637 domain-containing protein [Embleya sp. NPDC127516]|uniref:DUF2637 domain-containing protein n=1 Tax=Embleya sp. NPDC127516 TaxID=3363990 RepID=UPI003820A5E3